MRLQRNSLLLFLFVVFLCCVSVSFSLEILSDLNQTIVSRRNIFELGLFQPDKYTRSWYIGIWYKEDPKRTVLWVANRDHPLFESNFSLRLTDNNLILYNHLNLPIWSTNLIGGDGSSSQPMVVELLDSGNLVLKNTNKKDSHSILWQSFDFPTDTLLPEMTLGMNPKTGADIFLQSWISSDNPASGVRIMEIVNRGGLFQIFVNYVEYGFNVYAHRRDPWNGIQFGDMPQVFEWDKVSFTFVMSYGRNYSRLTLTPGGNYNLYKWVQEKKEWELSWSTERDVCSGYPCGSYAYCLENKSLLTCLCIEGFIPLSTLPWAAGNKFSCRRKTKLNCRGDEFLMLKNMRIPDTTGVTVDMKINSKECLRMCQVDCYCTAFAYVGIGQRGCVIWTRELTDIRNYSVGGQDLYVRLASNETGDTKETRLEERYITLIIVGGIAAFILGCFCLWKRMKRGSSHSQEPTETEIMMTELSREVFSFIALRTVAAATDNFSVSNELGRGGFGVVYKGILDDGTIVAVKRLSRTSLQGTIEFRNEVRTVLNVLHINLVRLLSCCCEGTERILVYEYMENLSLNRFLFRGALSRSLSWEQKFRIMGEIAQGLSYLHNSRDSPILHRDLKPSNILLDSNMTAKISDFGMAKFLESGQTEAQTQRVVGSYGYMSEEYAVSRIIIVFSGYMSEEYAVSRIMSDKSDLFSFGVVILEIIMEKQNFKFCNSFPGDSIIDLAWRTWNGGNYLSLVNSHLEDDSLVGDEVLKCLQIALCCLQDEAGSRPNADSVVLMLRGRSPDIPRPIKPNYYYSLRLARLATAASSSSVLVEETVSTVISSSDESVTFNEYTATVINSR